MGGEDTAGQFGDVPSFVTAGGEVATVLTLNLQILVAFEWRLKGCRSRLRKKLPTRPEERWLTMRDAGEEEEHALSGCME